MKLEHIIWTIILVVAGGYIAFRASSGKIGRVYVKGEMQDYAVTLPAPDSNGKVDKFKSTVSRIEAGQEAMNLTGASTTRIQWRNYKDLSAVDYWKQMEAEQMLIEAGGTPAPIAERAVVYQLSIWRTVGLWMAALFTLAIFSFLYRDNPFYKTAEAVVVGVSAAYGMVVGFWTTIVPNLFGRLWPNLVKEWWMPGMEPNRNLWYLVPLILGIMLLMRLSPKGSWISRWPLAFIIGTTAGFRMVGYFQADFVSQISQGIKPLYVTAAGTGFEFWASLANALLLIGVLSCLVYFFFSIEHKGIVGRTAQLGIWFLMITFGAGFGYTVMGRIALLAIRLEFLFDDWLWIIDPKTLHTVSGSG